MKKIVPCLDTRGGRLVKGVNFENVQDLGTPLDFAKRYNAEGADELVVLDITKTTEQHALRTQMISEISENISIPLTIGGGIASIQDIHNALDAGADKVGINSAAVKNPEFINEAADKFGSDKITIALDVAFKDDDYYIFTQAGQKQEAIKAYDWIQECENRGAGALLITSIDRDGAKNGFDIDFLKTAAELVDIDIIASGGAGFIQDFVDVFKETDVTSALAASVFHKEEINIRDLKAKLQAEGVDVNID